MNTPNYLVTYTELITMVNPVVGLTAPTGNTIATKSFINTYYHVDNTASPYSTYTANRCPPYQTILNQVTPYLLCYNLTITNNYVANCNSGVDEFQIWKISLVDQFGNAFIADQDYFFGISYDYTMNTDVPPYYEAGSSVTTLAILQGQWQGFVSFTINAIETCPYSGVCDGSCNSSNTNMTITSSPTGIYSGCTLPSPPSSTTTTTTSAYIPVTGLTWSTTSNTTSVPSCLPSGWVISNQNLRIRYNIANSLNCNGTCNIIQYGTAVATITVGAVNTYLHLDFTGLGELQDAGFEKIKFKLNGGVYSNVELANGHAAGGGLGCLMGPIVKQYLVANPYLLLANTNYTFTIDFTTNDNLYQVDAFYEINLTFT